jgi:hypothetical protein
MMLEIMKDINSQCGKGIPVNCVDAQARYDSKTVLFGLEKDSAIIPLKGTFIVHIDSDCVSLDIEYRGHLEHFEPPNTFGYCFHLSQAHTDSIMPSSLNQSGVDFEVRVPFLSRH